MQIPVRPDRIWTHFVADSLAVLLAACRVVVVPWTCFIVCRSAIVIIAVVRYYCASRWTYCSLSLARSLFAIVLRIAPSLYSIHLIIIFPCHDVAV